MRNAVCLCLCFALAGCSADGSSGSIQVALDTSGLVGPFPNGGNPMSDDTGLARLELFPAYIVYWIEANDMDETLTGTWPEEIPDDIEDEIVIDVEVPAGEERSVSLDLIMVDSSTLATTYMSPSPGEEPQKVDIEAGQDTDLEITLTELGRGTVEASWSSSFDVASVSWVDERAGAVLPSAAADTGTVTVELSIGRTYWPRVELRDGTVEDLEHQIIELDRAGVQLNIELDLDS